MSSSQQHQRAHPRFITQERVSLGVEGRNELRGVWMRDLSKGGLYVSTEDPPPMRTRVEVVITSPDGDLVLTGEVVHVQPGPYGGVGIQFADLSPDRRKAIEAYVEGLAARLDDGTASIDLCEEEAEEILATANRFLRHFEQEDLYGALDASPNASPGELDKHIGVLSKTFETRSSKLAPATRARIEHAKALLRRVSRLMRDPERRRDYDFRHGHICAERRIAEAGSQDAIEVLDQHWHNLFPDRVQKANHATAEAIRAVNKLDYDKAVEHGEVALEDDPFNMELRDAVREWKHRIAQRNAPPPRTRKRSA